MNIHFTDAYDLKDTLDSLTAFRVKVGSVMYGLETEDSDIDYLSIYIEPSYNRNSFLWEHHQLQYKHNNIDYNYRTLQTFIRNILTGDSTINFEVLFSEELKESELGWLYEYRFDFINYNIIKSYLGLAKRDLKMWRRDTKNGNHTIESNKKLSHFFRGILVARNCMRYLKLRPIEDATRYADLMITQLTPYEIAFLKEVKSGVHSYDTKILELFENMMNEDREELNNLLDERSIEKYIHPITLRSLDAKATAYCDAKIAKIDARKIDYKDLLYKDFGKEIQYDN